MIGLVAKAFYTPKPPDWVKSVEILKTAPIRNDLIVCIPKSKRVIVKKCDDGKFLIRDIDTGKDYRGNIVWTHDTEIELI